MKIGMGELLVILIIALVILGPDKFPEYARKLGEALRQFKKYSSEATKDIRESIVEPMQEAQRPLREAMEPLEDLKKDVTGSIKSVEKDLNSIGKAKPKETAKEEKPAEDASVPAETARRRRPAPGGWRLPRPCGSFRFSY